MSSDVLLHLSTKATYQLNSVEDCMLLFSVCEVDAALKLQIHVCAIHTHGGMFLKQQFSNQSSF